MQIFSKANICYNFFLFIKGVFLNTSLVPTSYFTHYNLLYIIYFIISYLKFNRKNHYMASQEGNKDFFFRGHYSSFLMNDTQKSCIKGIYCTHLKISLLVGLMTNILSRGQQFLLRELFQIVMRSGCCSQHCNSCSP